MQDVFNRGCCVGFFCCFPPVSALQGFALCLEAGPWVRGVNSGVPRASAPQGMSTAPPAPVSPWAQQAKKYECSLPRELRCRAEPAGSLVPPHPEQGPVMT